MTKIRFSISLSASKSMWLAYAVYAKNNDLISRTVLVNSVSGTRWSFDIDLPSNAYYIIFTYRSFNIATVAISYPSKSIMMIDDTDSKVESNGFNIWNIWNKVSGYVNNNGSISADTSSADSYTIDRYPVLEDEQYCLFSIMPDTPWYAFCYYNLFNTVVGSRDVYSNVFDFQANGKYYSKTVVTIPTGAYRTRVSCRTYGETGNVCFCKVGTQIYYDWLRFFDLIQKVSQNTEGSDIARFNYSKVGSNIKTVNHRGYSFTAPENTMPAFELSVKNNFAYVETDVCYTSDGIPVLLHDATINRTARNADGTELLSTINIYDITYAQSQNYDFGIWKGATYAGTKIPKLIELLAYAKKVGLGLYIELKPSHGYVTEDILDIVGVVKSYGMLKNTTFVSNTQGYLNTILTAYPNVRCGLIHDTVTADDVTWASGKLLAGNDVFISTKYDNYTAKLTECISANVPLEIYGTASTDPTLAQIGDYISGVTCNALNVSLEMRDDVI